MLVQPGTGITPPRTSRIQATALRIACEALEDIHEIVLIDSFREV